MLDVRNTGHMWGYRWTSVQKGWRKKSYAEYPHFTWCRWGYDRRDLTMTELRLEYEKAFNERLKVNLRNGGPEPWLKDETSGLYYLKE